MKKTWIVWKKIAWTQKKSQAQVSLACDTRNFRQPGEGPLSWIPRMYLATVRAETLKPNLASSAWIRFCPHSEFSVAMRRMSISLHAEFFYAPNFPEVANASASRPSIPYDAKPTRFPVSRSKAIFASGGTTGTPIS